MQYTCYSKAFFDNGLVVLPNVFPNISLNSETFVAATEEYTMQIIKRIESLSLVIKRFESYEELSLRRLNMSDDERERLIEGILRIVDSDLLQEFSGSSLWIPIRILGGAAAPSYFHLKLMWRDGGWRDGGSGNFCENGGLMLDLPDS